MINTLNATRDIKYKIKKCDLTSHLNVNDRKKYFDFIFDIEVTIEFHEISIAAQFLRYL